MHFKELNIRVDELIDPQVIEFLEDHLQHMIDVTPPGCVHALNIDELRSPEITFWTVWENDTLICCGALKELGSDHAELKSMRTAPTHLGKGIASGLLLYIISDARKRHIKRISLETGSYNAFLPARKLYEKFGFKYCQPFADYSQNSHSVFMTLQV